MRLILIPFLLLTTLCLGQSVWLDSNNVCMTEDKYAYYYVVERNFLTVRDSFPSLIKDLEKERAKEAEIQLNLKAQIENANQQQTILKKSRQEWANKATALEINMMSLRADLIKERKRRWVYVGGGAFIGIILAALI